MKVLSETTLHAPAAPLPRLSAFDYLHVLAFGDHTQNGKCENL
jgi:hypothetical protein